MKNDGKDAEKAFFDHWYRVGHIERIRDKKDLMGLNGGRNVADFAKPSDFLVSSPSIAMHYAEVKSTTDGKCFAFSKIRDGQAKAARCEVVKGQGAYFFYIFSYATGLWYVMSAAQYVTVCDSGRRSIKFEELERWVK